MKVNEFLNRTVIYGGLPVTYGEMLTHLQECAKAHYPEDKNAQQKAVNAYLSGRLTREGWVKQYGKNYDNGY